MSYTAEEVIAKYVELRDRKEEMVKRHKEELEPLNKAMENIETFFLAKTQEEGVDSYRTSAGTAFKTTAANVSLSDPDAFKDYVFLPAIQDIVSYFTVDPKNRGVDGAAVQVCMDKLKANAKWGLIDFRAGKKGIEDVLNETNTPVPGVEFKRYLKINIRRA